MESNNAPYNSLPSFPASTPCRSTASHLVHRHTWRDFISSPVICIAATSSQRHIVFLLNHNLPYYDFVLSQKRCVIFLNNGVVSTMGPWAWLGFGVVQVWACLRCRQHEPLLARYATRHIPSGLLSSSFQTKTAFLVFFLPSLVNPTIGALVILVAAAFLYNHNQINTHLELVCVCVCVCVWS